MIKQDSGGLTQGQLILIRLATGLSAAVASIALGAGLVLLGTRLFFGGRALPGVVAAGVELSGLSQPEIELALGDALTYPRTGTIVLEDQGRLWLAKPHELGVIVNAPAMADQALAVGRQGNLAKRLVEQVTAWNRGVTVVPIVIFDQRIGQDYMRTLAGTIDRPQIEAALGVAGLEIEMRPGQVGRRLDIGSSLAAIEPYVSSMHDASLTMVVEETPPLVLDASQEAAIAREIVSQPLTLTADGAGPWTFEPATLASLLRFNLIDEGGEASYQVGLDPGELTNFLEPLAPQLAREPENARFIFNDDTRELDLLQGAVIGRTLDLPATLEAINAGLRSGVHQIELQFVFEQPEVSSEATAADLGISEAVSVVSSFFAGSSEGRIRNITTAASAFHGLLVPPGATLSMAEILGDISLDKGYAEALIIYGDRTIKGVGGGVCQVSTTLFRAAFFGGYPIVERYPHAYRVGYYEQGRNSPGPGFDATVFVPLVDFKFTNDTPNWLLLETYIYGTQLLWKFYSTSDGRQVSISGPRISGEIEAPKPLYKENPDLQEGEIKQVDFEADGMDVVVTRTVSRGGQMLYDDIVKTHYLPWRAIYEFGPGTELPEDAIIEGET